jgi:hypothetical protein
MRLDQSTFPFIKDAPPEYTSALRGGPSAAASLAPPPAGSSLRSARPTWHKAPSTRMMNTEGKQRMIVFVAGGMTYSEMRLAYTVGQSLGKEVFIGMSRCEAYRADRGRFNSYCDTRRVCEGSQSAGKRWDSRQSTQSDTTASAITRQTSQITR